VQRKKPFHERAAEVEQRHLESAEVVGHVATAFFEQALADHGCNGHRFGRKRSALNIWLESHSGPDTWQLVKTRVARAPLIAVWLSRDWAR
jgi:hypothetical protein